MNALSFDKLWVTLTEQKRQWSFYYLQTEPQACAVVQGDLSKLKWIFHNSWLKSNNSKAKCQTVLASCKEGVVHLHWICPS